MDERENRSINHLNLGPVISCKDEISMKKNPMKLNTLNKKTIVNYLGQKSN